MPSSYGAYPHIHGGSAKEQRRSNQKPDTLMQDASARVDETSCTARPDHLSAGPYIGVKTRILGHSPNYRLASALVLSASQFAPLTKLTLHRLLVPDHGFHFI